MSTPTVVPWTIDRTDRRHPVARYVGHPAADAVRVFRRHMAVKHVHDPTTGQVRSRQTDRIALWMVDTDDDDESFFVRQAYFTGGGDPMKLERALEAVIDPDAWAPLYRTTSLAFDPPSTGRIAVEVIDDHGDEVMEVYDVASAGL